MKPTEAAEESTSYEEQATDPRIGAKRHCFAFLLALFVFCATVGGFLLIDPKSRKQFFMTKEEKFQKSLYKDPPANGKYEHVTQQFPPSCKKGQLPSTFLWGTTSSAFQIEGAVNEDSRGPSIWDLFSHTGGMISNQDTADVAADHYHRVAEDVQLLKSFGVKAYRFSISWPRIVPRGVSPSSTNSKGVDFYSSLVNQLLAAGITPVATMYHWDLPLALDSPTGTLLGWEDPAVADHFRHYAEILFGALGDRVKHWVTFNEPWMICQQGYAGDQVAPGKKSADPFKCGHNVLLAHAEAVKAFRAGGYLGRIGMALNGDFNQPYGVDSWKDFKATERLSQSQIGWFADPLIYGTYPPIMTQRLGKSMPTFTPEQAASLKGSVDFLGVNYFTAKWVSNAAATTVDPFSARAQQFDWKGRPMGVRSGSDWLQSVPWGLRRVLKWMDHRYNKTELWITSNGVSVKGEDALPVEEVVGDAFRLQYFKDHLQQLCLAASDDKINVKAYFAYTFLDSFEWRRGYTERFGITHVNLTTLDRTPKASAAWLRDFWAQML